MIDLDNRQIDVLVAEKVLGMRLVRVKPDWYRGVEVLLFFHGLDWIEYSYDDNYCNATMYRNGRDATDGYASPLPSYSDDMGEAWSNIVPAVLERFTRVELHQRKEGCVCRIESDSGPVTEGYVTTAEDPNPARAICLAALKAFKET